MERSSCTVSSGFTGEILTRVERLPPYFIWQFSTFSLCFLRARREPALPPGNARSLVTINHARDTLTKKYYTRVNNVNLC